MKTIMTLVLLVVSSANGIRPEIQQQLDQARSNFESTIASQRPYDEFDQYWFRRERRHYVAVVQTIVANAGDGMNSQEKREIEQGLQKNDSQ